MESNNIASNINIPLRINRPLFVAEIGCNHTGDINVAKQMIIVAKTCGANVAKFQKRCPKELLAPEQYEAIYDNPNSYGHTYGEHREFLEFDAATHEVLKNYSEENGIDYSTSVWDLTSAKEIVAIGPKFIKVPSACGNHRVMLEFLRDNFSGEVHLSSGMTTKSEMDEAIDIFSKCPERVVLYACTSGYPVPFKDVCMLEILRLKERYEQTGKVKSIGFSGHHNGIAIDLGAAMLGVSVIERHFTLDRAWKGSDHAASLAPDGYGKLVRDIHHLVEAWSFKSQEILSIEEPQRMKLKYRQH